MRTRLLALLGLCAAALVACSPDPPSYERAIEIMEEHCEFQLGLLRQLERPGDTFELGDVAGQAFKILNGGLGEQWNQGLTAMSEEDVKQYLDGSVEANNLMGSLSGAAGSEDPDRIDAVLTEVAPAIEDLEQSSELLGLPDHCAGPAWGGEIYDQASEIADAERAAMAPTGDHVADVTRYCERYRNRVARVTAGEELREHRAYAWNRLYALAQLRERLGLLEPGDPDLAATHAELLATIDATVTLLEPAEEHAIDGEADELAAIVDATRSNEARVDELLAASGADC